MLVKNRLLNYKNAYIYQDTEYFKMSLDSMLLAKFVTINLSDKKILDIATGNAPIPMLLTYRTKAKIYGVELQTEIYCLGKFSVAANGMDKQIELINKDARDLSKTFKSDYFDVITCNPPYFKTENELYKNKNMIKSIARHEEFLKLPDVFSISRNLLKNNGRLAIVHRTERLMEILTLMKEYNFEPKRIRFVYPKKGKNSNLVLIEATLNGKKGLRLLPPLFVHDDNGKYTKEIKEMFSEDYDDTKQL